MAEPVYFTENIPQPVRESAAAMRKACLEWPTQTTMPDTKTSGLGTYLNICHVVRRPSALNETHHDHLEEGIIYGACGVTGFFVVGLVLAVVVRRMRRRSSKKSVPTAINVPVRLVVTAETGPVGYDQSLIDLKQELAMDARGGHRDQ